MRKFFHFLVFLFFTFLFCQCFVIFVSKEHHLKYQVIRDGRTFVITEKYQKTHGRDLYHFTINEDFIFDVFAPLYKTSKLIEDILYYKDNTYTCIYPIFRTKKIKMDILCKNDHLVFYQNIKGQNKKLDAFAKSIPSYASFTDDDSKKKMEGITIYPNHLPSNHFIALQNYKGIYSISKKNLVSSHAYYTNDVYEPTLAISKDKYFVTALYEDEDVFDQLVVIRLDKNKKTTIKIPKCSLSSRFHLVDNQIYLEDFENRRIYLILPDKKTYREVNAIPKKSNLRYKNQDYDRIEESLFYYYLYKEIEDKILVSRVSKENTSIITDLFMASSPLQIRYYDEFIYFISGNSLYCYSDATGLLKVLTYDELYFNKALSYFVYKKH